MYCILSDFGLDKNVRFTERSNALVSDRSNYAIHHRTRLQLQNLIKLVISRATLFDWKSLGKKISLSLAPLLLLLLLLLLSLVTL